ncbi:MAG: phosphoglucosamine mutase [Flavobacteriales bacterium]|nr:phosphoglucosamine mutase [Flavobacteriales bacterium]
MTLITSISGIRGTIGGKAGEGLTPPDIVKFTSAFAGMVKQQANKKRCKVVIGRDARISGEMVSQLVSATLCAMGMDVIDLGLSTTPTVEMAVPELKADAGIILTASHNPIQWNALKLLNSKGEFISGAEGEKLLELAAQGTFSFNEVMELGSYSQETDSIKKHIDAILALPLVDKEAIAARNFKVAVDAVNSTGGIAVPALLEALGVKQVEKLYCEPTGHFPHNPEPLPAHLTDISATVKDKGCDVGIVVDPDVDRLAMVCEDGSMFGEEYTLVAVADYVLRHTPGNTVSNMSSTRALRDVTEASGGEYFSSAVGEVNVVTMMKEKNAVIGGEGNGGVIYPALHYGRDALAGIALFLTHLAKCGMTCTELRKSYPDYHISKNKIELDPSVNVDDWLGNVVKLYDGQPMNLIDGVKIEFGKEWVHLRRSNTEPIVRVYAESESAEKADALAREVMDRVSSPTHG